MSDDKVVCTGSEQKYSRIDVAFDVFLGMVCGSIVGTLSGWVGVLAAPTTTLYVHHTIDGDIDTLAKDRRTDFHDGVARASFLAMSYYALVTTDVLALYSAAANLADVVTHDGDLS